MYNGKGTLGHSIYDNNDVLVTYFQDEIDAEEVKHYNLNHISAVPNGFRGYVVIASTVPIEASRGSNAEWLFTLPNLQKDVAGFS